MTRVPATITEDQATITAVDQAFTLVAEDSPIMVAITAAIMVDITVDITDITSNVTIRLPV